MIAAYIFILGLAMGSFINASVWRLGQGRKVIQRLKSAQQHSICEHCKHRLAAWDLIPVISWLTLRGRCRYCGQPISIIHPLVELLTALLFLSSWLYWPEAVNDAEQILSFSLWLVFLTGLIMLAIYDLKHLEILNIVVYPMIALAMLWRLIEALIFGGGAGSMREMALGLAVGGGFFLALFYISRERWIGGGDVKLGFFYGVWLGPLYALAATLIGFYSAFLVVIPLLLLKRLKRQQPVPFGPFLIIGVYTATLWGAPLVEWFDRTFLLS